MSLEAEQVECDDDSLTTGWFDIPYEMRSIVIDYMEMLTKFRFSRCSKLCYEEVQLSRNFLRAIQLDTEGLDRAILLLKIDGYASDQHYSIASQTYLSNNAINQNRTSTTARFEFPSKKEAYEFVVQTLRCLLKLSKNSLKQLVFQLPDFPYDQMKMENFRNLEKVTFPKNHQLDPIRSGFINIDQLGCISEFIKIPNLTTDEILKLKAKVIWITDSDGEPVDIKALINHIFDGELDENVRYVLIQPEPRLDNIDGIFAKRGHWNYRLNRLGFDYLVKRSDKFILLQLDFDSYIIKTNFSPNLNGWTLL